MEVKSKLKCFMHIFTRTSIVTTLVFTCVYFGTYNLQFNYFNYTFARYPNAPEDTIEWLKKMEDKYSEENKTIKSVCQKYHKNVSQIINLKELMIDTYFNWGYCPNAKVGTSSWVQHFIKLMTTEMRPDHFIGPFDTKPGAKRQKCREFFRASINSTDPSYSRKLITKSMLTDYLEEHSILMFSFVRHPFERLVSTFMDKVLDRVDRVDSVQFVQRNITAFPEFVEIILKQHREENMNKHMKPFQQRCQYCTIPYDVIGRMETFDEDLKYIIIKNKLEDILPLEVTVGLHKNGHGKDTREERENHSLKLFSELDKNQIEQLYEIYKIDFELFRYNVSAYFDLS